MNYKNSINLFETKFPMKADLAKREPFMIEKWQKQNRYNKIREIAKGRKKFILHDGPPYANGQLHIGHAANKILKDIIIRFKTLSGFDAPFIPGWDCHGLPIELNIEKKYGNKLLPTEFRNKCREYANEQIEIQKKDFIRLGILANWDNPYKTMNFDTQANIIKAMGEIYKAGYLARGTKPVHWCINCGSALAEAEVEYQDKTSPSIYVKFKIADVTVKLTEELMKYNLDIANLNILKTLFYYENNTLKLNQNFNNTFILIWTTTPWTLPANQAIAINAKIEYSLIKYCNDNYIIATNLIEHVLPKDSNYHIIAKQSGEWLKNIYCLHPFYNKQVPLICGEHVTTDSGTGLVHTAPAHGLDDFIIGLANNLEVYCPVGDDGKFISTTEIFAGKSIWEANKEIILILNNNNSLFANETITHSYPHCWRHKSPIIFRSTPQWFIFMDKLSKKYNITLRKLAIDSIAKTKFFPQWGFARLEAMIKNRPDWCVSRQRNWGVPMSLFVHKETYEPHPQSYEIYQKISQAVEKHGVDIWYDNDFNLEALGYANHHQYKKLTDTMDVWFDSGTTHFSVLKSNPNLSFPADLYLEGSDQHRGWFQSSLLTSCAINNQAPYKQILTHGFLVDGQGYKMSKSKGNIISIPEGTKNYGADILRLWTASIDFSNDISFSEEIIKNIIESYRRIRNTLRFILANLVDFDPNNHQVNFEELVEVDKYALIKLVQLQTYVVNNLYENYQFHIIVQNLITYCSEDLGGFYLDILKDRLYTSNLTCKIRRSAQTTLFHIGKHLALILSPILSFTADEFWEELTHNDEDSTLYHTFMSSIKFKDQDIIIKRWNKIESFRKSILKELEIHRVNGEIGSSLQAELIINADCELYQELSSIGSDLKFVYMVSKIDLNLAKENSVIVNSSNKKKCERCWHYSIDVGAISNHVTICKRCFINLESGGEQREYA